MKRNKKIKKKRKRILMREFENFKDFILKIVGKKCTLVQIGNNYDVNLMIIKEKNMIIYIK